MQDMRDKLVLDTTDNEELAEHFSRKSPGDTCKFTVEGTLDENHEGVVVLSVTDVVVQAYKDKKEGKEKTAVVDESQPAIQMAKRRKAEEAEGMGY